MYNQPDFQNIKSILETEVVTQGFKVIFLPKFHCELNPIKQCWGYAKQTYCLYPPSLNEADLEFNVVKCLKAIPLITMRWCMNLILINFQINLILQSRFAVCSLRFIDAYRKGLNGHQTAWASKKYQGHRVIPDNILDELEKVKIA